VIIHCFNSVDVDVQDQLTKPSPSTDRLTWQETLQCPLPPWLWRTGKKRQKGVTQLCCL